MTPRKPKPPLTVAQAKRLAELVQDSRAASYDYGHAYGRSAPMKEKEEAARAADAAERSFTVYLSRLTIAAEQ